MSHALIARNPDLKRLQEAGYALRIQDGYLLVEGVPYITNATGSVQEGTLVMLLDLSGDDTVQPADHVAYWTGTFPYRAGGQKLLVFGENEITQLLSDGTAITHMFSAKPTGGRYQDYEHKVKTYVEIIEREARQLSPSATAKKWKVIRETQIDEVFEYMETASARQNTVDISAQLVGEKVAIIGLGGTGSYVLDFVAKTWVREIHLYDDDRFLQHNAFRAPGAPGVEEIEGGPSKVEFHAARYAKLRKGVIGHPVRIDEINIDKLRTYQTIFLCIDGHRIKKAILETCEKAGGVCIDTGMGIYREGDKLGGIVRTTTSEPAQRDHIQEKNRIDMAGGGVGEYERNMQMAELNALNAALAVIKWKKIRGIYQDQIREGDSGYILDGNKIINRDLVTKEVPH